MHKLTYPVLFLGLGIASLAMLGQYNDARANLHDAKHSYVYTICEISRTQIDGSTEQQCADAQYDAKVEYLCTMRNSLTTNYCWTEDNDQLERW